MKTIIGMSPAGDKSNLESRRQTRSARHLRPWIELQTNVHGLPPAFGIAAQRAERLPHELPHPLGLIGLGQVLDDDREVLIPDTCEGVGGPETSLQPSGD